jgi:hypothetical protein
VTTQTTIEILSKGSLYFWWQMGDIKIFSTPHMGLGSSTMVKGEKQWYYAINKDSQAQSS